MGPFHRDQQRIDAIGWLLHDHGLVKDEQIHQLAHDCGDLEDAAAELSDTLNKLRVDLQQITTNPKECWLTLLAICGWFDEFRYHMDSAEPLIYLICKDIERRHPEINPEEDSPDET